MNEIMIEHNIVQKNPQWKGIHSEISCWEERGLAFTNAMGTISKVQYENPFIYIPR